MKRRLLFMLKTSMLLIILILASAQTVLASTSEYVTMNVGERRTLSLPSDIASLQLKDVTFTSGDWSKLKVVTNTLTTVTVEALEKSSGYVPITCEFYYYTLVDGKWIYAHHAPFYFMVAIIGDSNPQTDEDSNTNAGSGWTREGNTDWWTSIAYTIEGVKMKFLTNEWWTYFSSICEPYYKNKGEYENEICIDRNTAGTITIPAYVSDRRVEGTGMYSFRGCTKITTVIVPNTVELFGGFSGCTSLTSINIPSKVTFIRTEALRNCRSLSSIILPRLVNEIKSLAFSGCESLKTVYSLNTTPPKLDDWAFDNAMYNDIVLYVPKGAKESYQSAYCWKQFKQIEEIVLPTDVTIPSSQTIALGSTIKLSPTVMPVEAMDTIIWQSSNPKVAIISQEGVLAGVGIGTATITATTINGLTATCEVTCEQANHEVTMSAAGYATFYSSESAYTLPEGLSAQVVTGASNNKLTYKTIADGSVSGVIPINTAVMLVSDAKQAGTFTLTSTKSTVAYTGTNLLIGSNEATTTTGEGYHYKLSYGHLGTSWYNVFGWYWGAQDGTPFQIDGHKAWLVVPKTSGTRTRSYSIDGNAIDIEEVDEEVNGMYCDLQGRHVTDIHIASPFIKGVYIRNGKKVVK